MIGVYKNGDQKILKFLSSYKSFSNLEKLSAWPGASDKKGVIHSGPSRRIKAGGLPQTSCLNIYFVVLRLWFDLRFDSSLASSRLTRRASEIKQKSPSTHSRFVSRKLETHSNSLRTLDSLRLYEKRPCSIFT
jgi:hypothetical protein